MTTDVLVVGYGSDLRGDDAAGRRAVDAVAARALPGVRVLSLPQLLPELAADLDGCRAPSSSTPAPSTNRSRSGGWRPPHRTGA